MRIRVPYPMGFFSRFFDARIDNPNTGWKGRGLWAANQQRGSQLTEGGNKDIDGLHALIDRDDLLIDDFPARQALMNRIPLGECIFEFSNPRTQHCLLKRTGYDLAQALKQRPHLEIPKRPVSKAALFDARA